MPNHQETVAADMLAAGCTAQQISSVLMAMKGRASKEDMANHRAKNRDRQRRFRERNASNVTVTPPMEIPQQNQQTCNVTVTLPKENGVYIIEEDYVELVEVRKKEVSKKERKIRALGKVPFPSDWPNQEVIAALAKAGFAESQVVEQIEMMRDWALQGGKTMVDWVAFARNWLRRNAKTPQFGSIQNRSARPLTFHQAKELHNRRVIDETLFPNGKEYYYQSQRPALGRPAIQAIPDADDQCFDA